MPYSSPADVPDSVKTFFTRVKASPTARRQWVSVANSCLARLGEKEIGRCIASANAVLKRRLGINTGHGIDAILDASSITDTLLDGRAAWQIPAVFTREGVQNRAFKPWKELVKAAWSLVDAPVVFPHPPALDSAMAHEALIIGRIVSFEADNKERALRGNIAVWKSDPRSQWLVHALQHGGGQHGSVGFTYENEATGGDFNSESYINVERDLFFDHFAVGLEFFGKRGACAPPMCGLLHNDEEEDPMADPNAEHPDTCPEGQHMVEGKCVDMDDKDRATKITRQTIREMNIWPDEETFEAEAAKWHDDFDDCPCHTPEGLMGIDQVIMEDQTFTYNPPWSAVDKSKLPSSAFLVVPDPEKKSTWKLPFKNSGGAINCNAVRAIVQVLGGVDVNRTVSLTGEQRANARRQAASMWRRCLAIRQNASKLVLVKGDGEELIYTVPDIKDTEEQPMSSEETKESEKLQARVDELATSLEKATEKIEAFEKDEEERIATALTALRDEVVSLAKDSEVFSDEELKEMDSVQLKIAKKFLGTKPAADHGIGGSSGDGKDDENATEFIHGREFSKLTIGDLYKAPSMNPPLQATNEGD